MHVVAYIDAGTGSYVLAAIASGVAGAWFFLHAQISKIRRKLTGKSNEVVELDVEQDSSADGAEEVVATEVVTMESEQSDPQSLDK